RDAELYPLAFKLFGEIEVTARQVFYLFNPAVGVKDERMAVLRAFWDRNGVYGSAEKIGGNQLRQDFFLPGGEALL
ncbi:MAG: hypothetical protein M3P30_11585, partial [Chloroflexota bacterium]|nr:hypothetical protein [Chloroflexota bacterium]